MGKSVNLFLPVFIAIIVATLLSSGIWLTSPDNRTKPIDPGPKCESACNYELVETMPVGLYDNQDVIRFKSTADAWKKLMSLAKKNVEITAFYWSLLANDTGDGFVWDDSAQTGTDIYNQLIELGKKGIKIGINQDNSSNLYEKYESDNLAELGYATVRSLDFRKWFGGGVLHTKSWLIDDQHFYVGSANHDWRSLSQVKELGIAVYDCPCLTADLKKIYDVYKYMGTGDQEVPSKWSDDLGTAFNSRNPMNVRLGNDNTLVYLTSSPPPFVPTGREHDGETLARVINEAEKFVYISVMDYAPTTLYQKPNYYWPVIDDAIRHAAFDRRAHVRLLMSRWGSTRSALYSYLHSLRALNSQLPCDRLKNETTGHYYCKEGTKGSIEIKLFEVPQYKVKIPFARVNHAKYLVTEKNGRNLADYFITTGGISVVIQSTSSQSAAKVVDDVSKLHERDWNSSYSTSIDEFTEDGKRKDKT
ncbi:Phospholipase D/Transphosphatidylase domain-containing protein [Aphelenchoides besseyi]|nr:Phospholipase D/Transphosphatidylase domain-containing protein [Aphelenchoides besseyi]